MSKKILSLALLTLVASFATAGGKGGTELALASYGGIGVVASKGIPLSVEFLRANGLYTYGEVEVGAGFGNNFALGAELSAGVLFGISPGLSIYGSLGPAIGMANDTSFGLGAEIGLNIDINDSAVVIEAGSHPASNYVSVGLIF